MTNAVHHARPALMVILSCACLWLVGCNQPAEAQPVASVAAVVASVASPASVIEVTRQIEVTRVVTQVIVVEATPQPPQSCAPDDIAQADTIVVGAILPLSLPSSMHSGFAMQTALNIAVEDINAAGGIHGKPVKLISYDSAGSPEQGATFAERLIVQDCVSALVGVYHASVGLAIKEVAHRYGIPLILTDLHADEYGADQYAEVFRIGPQDNELAQAPGQWMAEVGDYNGDGRLFAVFIVENNAHGATQAEQANLWMPAYVTEHEILTVDLPSADFSPVIARIVTMDKLPDAIFIRIHGDAGLELQRQLQDAGIGAENSTLIVNGAAALDDDQFWQLLPDGVHTVVQQIGPWSTAATPIGAAFAESYAAHHERWPEPHAFAAYDAMRLVADSMGRADSIAPMNVISALEESNIDLAAGHYHFPYGAANPPDGVNVPRSMWHQWPDFPLLFLQYTEDGQPAATMPVIWPEMYRTIDQPVVRPR